MLRLHGFASSNYHNVVKLALIEKGIEFEEVTTYPPADETFLAMNATGHYPCLEVADGTFLGETKVMLNYLEDTFPEVPLPPPDPLQRALVRELLQIIDLYLEWPARTLYPEALFGGKVSDEIKKTAHMDILRGVAGLKQRAVFDPFIAGEAMTIADLAAAIHLPLVGIACRAVYGEDLLAAIPEVQGHRKRMIERESLRRVKADREVDVSKFAEHRTTAGPIR